MAIAHFTDGAGWTASVTDGHITWAERRYGWRAGRMYITSPDGVTVKAMYWMDLPERSWDISQSEWRRMPIEKRLAFEAWQQALGYRPLAQQFERELATDWAALDAAFEEMVRRGEVASIALAKTALPVAWGDTAIAIPPWNGPSQELLDALAWMEKIRIDQLGVMLFPTRA